MRRYSRRERFLFGLLGALVILPAAVLMTYISATDTRPKGAGWWAGMFGVWGAAGVCAKAVITGTTTHYLEQSAFSKSRHSSDSKKDPPLA